MILTQNSEQAMNSLNFRSVSICIVSEVGKAFAEANTTDKSANSDQTGYLQYKTTQAQNR